ncbi:MAG: acetyl/propionyl/methylcrotonyl-CoA carboxylase subunit alpha [Pseudomonadota bacterium]
MFQSILIANRGEIACRVIKTAQRLGIRPIAVYSEADAEALHVRMARDAGGDAVAIGPAPSAESYLVIDRIVEACRSTGAEAVHPGYGFLSENGAFAEALAAAGVTFIGPGAKAIAAMGDKIESKKLAEQAGVNSVPGHLVPLKDADEAREVANRIGYPVMLKASAGGGGKGMRIAYGDDDVAEGFASATNEAKSSFGDDRVFAEKFIEQPRHIEIQVLADGHGNVVHLGERECSIQRRHQKVIEEAPSPFLDEATRQAMGAQAVALARAVDYRSAGTVEFIVDAARNFYFLEMNTRLQVEHPVTEAVTGLDLVEWMIRIAAGEPLDFGQEDVTMSGWAMEARVYAEDPARGFLPSTGRLVRYRPPAETTGIRIDTGVDEGGEISMFYDPMIAKIIGIGDDRAGAIGELRQALDGCLIEGVRHNLGFVSAVLGHRRFREGDLSTNFLAEEFGSNFEGAEPDTETVERLYAVAAALHGRRVARDRTLGGDHRSAKETWIIRRDRANQTIDLALDDGGAMVTLGGREIAIEHNWRIGQQVFDGLVGGRRLVAIVSFDGSYLRLQHAGVDLRVQVLSRRAAELADLMPVKLPPDLSKFLLSPMPGLLVSVAVEPGQKVDAGQTLAVVEAMKMENILRAEQPGTVSVLHARPGDSLAVDQKILEFE